MSHNNDEKKGLLETYYLVQFSEKTGEIKTTLSGMGKGMLQLWAMQNPKKGCEVIIFRLSDGEIAFYMDKDERIYMAKSLGPGENNIEDYCKGLLSYFQKYDKEEKEKKNGGNMV